MKEIKITCTGTKNISIDSFVELQGNLKELSKDNFTKLKNSILKYGFSFPVFCWRFKNKYYILDAHQRIRTLKELRKEGYSIPELPTCFIEAKDKTEASKKLLLLNSNFGKITEEGLYEFNNDFDIDFEEFKTEIDLPDFDFNHFEKNYYDDNDNVNNKNVLEHIYEVVISCESESEQEEIYNKLISEGYKCRILIL